MGPFSMSKVPPELRYSQNHEWIRLEVDGNYTVGITDYEQSLLGEMIFVDLPVVDEYFVAGKDCAVVESVKAAVDVYAPISGTVVAVNEELESDPGTVNRDPYGAGWLFRLEAEAVDELDNLLLGAVDYQKLLDESDGA